MMEILLQIPVNYYSLKLVIVLHNVQLYTMNKIKPALFVNLLVNSVLQKLHVQGVLLVVESLI